jgi:hypothetical protein
MVATNVNATAPSSSKRPLEKLAIRGVNPQTNSPAVDVSTSFSDRYAADCATKLAKVEEERWKSLSFQVMDDREDHIADAELETFEWILQPPQDEQRPWSSFIEWLETGNSIYWISGKAGSGKSTLMKYLKSHDMVQAALETWAVDVPLVTASFFFWYNGNELQKTQEGLLRSLIYQALENHRELIPLVLAGTFDVLSIDLVSYWTLARLKGAFRRLVEQKEVPLKICLLVDGLDEYAGNHAEIVEVFQYAARFEHVKICVSSRPLIVFDRAFKDLPGLRLQDLTFDDIQLYVRNRFHHDERFHELELEEPGLGPDLALQVVVKASGVFLWVKLVVHSVLEGIENYDRGVDLERRLNELPEDLTELYWHMLDRVKPVWYLEEGFRLLLLVRATIAPLTLLRLAFAELKAPANDNELSSMTIERRKALCRGIAGRIKSRCLGLIEVVDNSEIDETKSYVQFLHKSVADFIDTPKMMGRIHTCLAKTNSLWPEVAIMRAICIELETTTYGNDKRFKQSLNRGIWFDEVRPLGIEARRYAEITAGKYILSAVSTNALMDEIDKTMTKKWSTVNSRTPDEISGETHWSDAVDKRKGEHDSYNGGPLTTKGREELLIEHRTQRRKRLLMARSTPRKRLSHLGSSSTFPVF